MRHRWKENPVYSTGLSTCQTRFSFQIDSVELWEAQSKNPGSLEYHISQGSTAFAGELQAQDLVFSTDGGRITGILAHPEDPTHVLNVKRGILSALQVQFVDEHATLEEVRSSFIKFNNITRALIGCVVVLNKFFMK